MKIEGWKSWLALTSWFVSSQQYIISIYLSPTEFKAVALEQELGVCFAYGKSFETLEGEKSWYEDGQLVEECFSLIREKLVQEEYELDKATLLITLKEAAYMELLDMPCLKTEELEEALEWELPQHLPWQAESYVYRYTQRLREDIGRESEALSEVQEVTVYSVQKEILEGLQKVMAKLGLVASGVFVAEELAGQQGQYLEAIKGIDFYESFYNLDKLNALRSYYQEPIVSALAYKENKMQLNFNSKGEQRLSWLKQASRGCRNLAIVFLALGLCLVGAGRLWQGYDLNKLEQSKTSYIELQDWQEKRRALLDLENKLQRLQRQGAEMERERILWSKLLIGLGNNLPRGCWLTKVEQLEDGKSNKQGSKISLEGRAEATEQIGKFLENLKNASTYEEVALLQAASEQKNRLELQGFRINLKLKEGSGRKNEEARN